MNPFRPKPDAVRPGEVVIACPNPTCGSQRPFMPMSPLVSVVLRNGKSLAVQTGHQVGCLDCGEVYFIGPQGPWRRKAPRVQTPPPAANGDAVSPWGDDESGLLPRPLAPPRT